MANLKTITAVTPKVLASAQMASGDNAIYTVAANKAAKLATLTLCNTSAAPVVVSVAVVPSGGAVDGTHRIVTGYPLAAGDSLTMADDVRGMWLGDGDKINVNAAAATAVDAVLTGLEFS